MQAYTYPWQATLRLVVAGVISTIAIVGMLVLLSTEVSATTPISVQAEEEVTDKLRSMIAAASPVSSSEVLFLEENVVLPGYERHADRTTESDDAVVIDLALPWGENLENPGY